MPILTWPHRHGLLAPRQSQARSQALRPRDTQRPFFRGSSVPLNRYSAQDSAPVKRPTSYFFFLLELWLALVHVCKHIESPRSPRPSAKVIGTEQAPVRQGSWHQAFWFLFVLFGFVVCSIASCALNVPVSGRRTQRNPTKNNHSHPHVSH